METYADVLETKTSKGNAISFQYEADYDFHTMRYPATAYVEMHNLRLWSEGQKKWVDWFWDIPQTVRDEIENTILESIIGE